MDYDGQWVIYVILGFLALLFLLGYASAAETSLSNLDFTKNKPHNQKEKKLAELVKNSSDVLNTFLINKVLLISGITLYVCLNARAYVMSVIIRTKGDQYLSDNYFMLIFLVCACSLIVCTFMIMVFGIAVPKRLAGENSSDFARANSWYVRFLYVFLTPMRLICRGLTDCLLRLFGISSVSKDVVTEEEIMMMVNVSNQNGVIEQSQKEMINNIFEFADLDISDVMTHRTELVAVEKDTNISELIDKAISSGKSRIPVYDGDVDSIIGIINVKDLLKLIGREKVESFHVKDFIRDVIYVPETSSLDEAFKKLSAAKGQMAVVVDEYGGTAGIVTMEDILEEIVGNIQDEYDEETEDIVKISDGLYTIEGSANPEEIFEHLGLPAPSEHEYETMSGFIIDLLGRIPDEDEKSFVTYHGIIFTVLAVDDKKIVKIKALLPAGNEEDNNL